MNHDEPTRRRLRLNGIELCFFEWGEPRPGEPVFLLAHATGFHARCWDRVARDLAGRHVIAVDQRGHGRSEKHPIENWNVFGRDLVALADELDLVDIIGVGHSMGGHALTDAAAARPSRFRRLLLIDPVIAAPEVYAATATATHTPEPHPTARRRNHFRSPEEMIERFRDRAPYSGFHPDVLRDYCYHGLLEAPEGRGFVLACPPMIEASIYATSHSNPGVHESIRSLSAPVLIVRAKAPPTDRDIMDFSFSPTWPGLAREFPNAREIHLPQSSHFIPLEKPEYVAELSREDSPAGEARDSSRVIS